jgi:hypothetical protein
MIVDYLDIMRLAVGPTKADAPLIVDPNAPLAHTIPSQRLQMIAGWIAQVLQGQRSIDLPQLPQSALLDIAGKLATPLALPDSLGLFVAKRADHGPIRDT